MPRAMSPKRRSTQSGYFHWTPVAPPSSCNHTNSVVAGRGIITSAIATGVLGFITTILFLFCIPDLNRFFALDAPQPFVQLYALALGKGPSIFMTIIAVIGLIMVRVPYLNPVIIISGLTSRECSCPVPLASAAEY